MEPEDPSARERRQLHLMLDRLDRFKLGDLGIGPVINDLEALLGELQLAGDAWRQEFIESWSDLEIPYAVALDRLEPIPTAKDETVIAGVDALENLVRARLDALSA